MRERERESAECTFFCLKFFSCEAVSGVSGVRHSPTFTAHTHIYLKWCLINLLCFPRRSRGSRPEMPFGWQTRHSQTGSLLLYKTLSWKVVRAAQGRGASFFSHCSWYSLKWCSFRHKAAPAARNVPCECNMKRRRIKSVFSRLSFFLSLFPWWNAISKK